jgi:hypothetical protein
VGHPVAGNIGFQRRGAKILRVMKPRPQQIFPTSEKIFKKPSNLFPRRRDP